MTKAQSKQVKRIPMRRSRPALLACLVGIVLSALLIVFARANSIGSISFILIGAALVSFQVYLVLAFPKHAGVFVARLGLLALVVLAFPAIVATALWREVPASVGMPLLLVTTWVSIAVAIWAAVAALIDTANKTTRDLVIVVVAGVLAAGSVVGFMTQFERVASPVPAVANVQFPNGSGISSQSGHAVVLTIQVDDSTPQAASMDGSTVHFDLPAYYGVVKFATAVDSTVVSISDPWLVYPSDPGSDYLNVLRSLLSFGVLLPDRVLTIGLVQPG